ncbi:MAG: hybD [Gemmataceae bacterium]|nr:hybD [Gemmataceae bacterium]
MNRARVLVAGVGNIFLGDDAFGVEVVRELAGRPLPDGVRVVDFGIRGLDLTYALLDGYEAVILVDATPRGGQPGTLYVLEVDPPGPGEPGAADLTVEGHNLDPAKVLRLAAAMGSPARRLLVVGCEPAPPGEFEEMAAGLSRPVRDAVGEAVSLVESLAGTLLAAPGGNAVSEEVESCRM